MEGDKGVFRHLLLFLDSNILQILQSSLNAGKIPHQAEVEYLIDRLKYGFGNIYDSYDLRSEDSSGRKETQAASSSEESSFVFSSSDVDKTLQNE